MSFLKCILATMCVVLLISQDMVSGSTHCLGPCGNYYDCFDECEALGYTLGLCIPPDNYFCCCSIFD
ncbi:hypothetical protein Lalb_Chr03g0036701 [Lupinus albus]|uniref:Knottin, scorpion toxin n=1 Tax=Lupinus albus TaxID=3870 RepID=A0A6A4QS16_LUPAL|nr:hypothetical protein Lalb_Chr03g0036701 [Lupinus albus]